jgi:hypothetical protein
MRLTFKKLFFGLMVLAPAASYSQGDINQLLKSGLTDVNSYASAYLEPLGRGFSSGLGTNWYNTAAPHKLFGFDLTIGTNVAFMPSSMNSFSTLGFKNLKPSTAADNISPTVTGSKDGEVNMDVYAGGTKVTTIKTAPGIGYSYIPSANVQLAVGLPYKTEVIFRIIPTITVKDFSIGQLGIGVKHDIKQWIPIVKDLPFDMSVILGYSKFTAKYTFPDPITPDQLGSNIDYNGDAKPFEGQNMKITSSAFMANVIVSKKLMFFTPYMGLGFSSNKFDLGLKGRYPIIDNSQVPASLALVVPTVINDPVNVSYTSFNPNLTVGFRLKILWVLGFHAQYTLQKYPVASAGFGINIR